MVQHCDIALKVQSEHKNRKRLANYCIYVQHMKKIVDNKIIFSYLVSYFIIVFSYYFTARIICIRSDYIV